MPKRKKIYKWIKANENHTQTKSRDKMNYEESKQKYKSPQWKLSNRFDFITQLIAYLFIASDLRKGIPTVLYTDSLHRVKYSKPIDFATVTSYMIMCHRFWTRLKVRGIYRPIRNKNTTDTEPNPAGT